MVATLTSPNGTDRITEFDLDDLHRADVAGIWDDSDLFTRYRVSLTFAGRVMGGVPQKPEIIESWLRRTLIGGDEELRMQLLKTLDDLDIEVPLNPTREEIVEAANKVAATRNGNTFRRNDQGLYLSDYQIKALFKECTNILFAGDRWGVTKKGPKSFLSERVFVDESKIHLGRGEADGVHLQVGQVSGPKGPRSTLTYYDYCENATVHFTVSSLNDCITLDQWKKILLLGQREGIGALRSMGYGQFRVTAFDRVK